MEDIKTFKEVYEDISIDDCLNKGSITDVGRGMVYDFNKSGYSELRNNLSNSDLEKVEEGVAESFSDIFTVGSSGLELMEELDSFEALNDDNTSVTDLKYIFKDVLEQDYSHEDFYTHALSKYGNENMPTLEDLSISTKRKNKNTIS